MPDSTATNPAIAAFAERLRAFHAGLPPGEQQLLEATLRLAALAEDARAKADVSGYLATAPFVAPLITSIGFPALDAGSKDAAKLTIKVTPEYTRTTTTSGGAP
ncbi:MAG TPA: hypothetical protein VKV26_02295 [Dehalococcoidia bacterium]|nr:hypothetical protein [Dehalococcoidia bacterium]